MRIRFSFDTNILIYAADLGAGDKHLTAQEMIDCALAGRTGATTEQNIMEFLNVATRKLEISFRQAAEFVEDIAQVLEVLLARDDVVRRTLRLLASHRLSVWDARMVAVCGSHNCAVLFSEDMQDRALYDGVRIIDPFRTSNQDLVREVLKS